MKIRCPVCLSELIIDGETPVTQCRHVFHDGCLKQWLLRSPTCPKCREPVKPGSLSSLFLEPLPEAQKVVAANNLDMEGFEALERCVDVLKADGGRDGVMPAVDLTKAMGVRRDELDVLLEAFPGCLVQYDVEAEEPGPAGVGVRRGKGAAAAKLAGAAPGKKCDTRVVELCPVLFFCWGGCIENKCRKLHGCRKFLMDGTPCKAGGRCRRGHSLTSAHNLRVLRKELEMDVAEAPQKLISDLVSFSLAKHARVAPQSSKKSEVEEEKEADGNRKGGKGSDARGARKGAAKTGAKAKSGGRSRQAVQKRRPGRPRRT